MDPANNIIKIWSVRFLINPMAGGLAIVNAEGNSAVVTLDSIKIKNPRGRCRTFNRTTLEFLLGHAEPNIVVLGSNWGNAVEISTLVDSLLFARKTVVLIMPLLNIGFDL